QYGSPVNNTGYPDYANATNLGTVSAGGDAVGKGTPNYNFNFTHTWKFTVGTNGGNYSFALDCNDDGSGKVYDYIWVYDANPLDVNSPLGSISGASPLNPL